MFPEWPSFPSAAPPANDNELILDPALKDRITVRKPLVLKKPAAKKLKDAFNPAARKKSKKPAPKHTPPKPNR
jgi:hypothetical protein